MAVNDLVFEKIMKSAPCEARSANMTSSFVQTSVSVAVSALVRFLVFFLENE